MFNLQGGGIGAAQKGAVEVVAGAAANKVVKKKEELPAKVYAKRDYTEAQIKELLVGYIQVAVDRWVDVPVGSHVRYVKRDGVFVRGGFVTSHWLNAEGKKFIHLANNIARGGTGYVTWPVAHESLVTLYKKVDAKSGIEIDVVREKTSEMIGQINRLVDVVKAQKNRLDALESDQKKMLAIIRKLNTTR